MRCPSSRLRTAACAVFGAGALFLFSLPGAAVAQGLIKGVEQGAREGNKAAGPVGGVLGGAIGGVVGVVTGVTGVLTGPTGAGQAPAPAPAQKSSKEPGKDKNSKSGKGVKPAPPPAAPLTAEQIVANSDANIERIKKELKLTPEQEKHWGQFASAMHYLGNNGAERLRLRTARAQRDPPDDIIEQMRNEAQFLTDRAADQRNVADAAEPLFATLDGKQKQVFVEEMVKLSRERGLD